MAALDYLFQGSPPPAVTTAAAASNGLPEWYAQYLQGIAGKGTEIAGSDRPIPLQSVAGLTPDEIRAQELVRGNVGSWQGALTQAQQTAGSALPAVGQAVDTANTAVAGPTQTWTSNYQQYMSPYTQGVVNDIARQGMRNWEERIMPTINGSMISTGQFGSTRNADALAKAGRDVSADITGQQSQALQQGYGMAAGIFGADAARAQQQQQMQAGTALTGANALAGATRDASSQLGALSQAQAAMGLGDAQALAAAGQGQRQVTQAGYNANYANQTAQNAAPWTDLNNLNSIVRGMQLPAAPTTVTNGPAAAYQPGALQQVGAAYGTLRS